MGFTSNRVGIIGGKKVCITEVEGKDMSNCFNDDIEFFSELFEHFRGDLKGSLVWKVVKISELLKMKEKNISRVCWRVKRVRLKNECNRGC